MSLKPKDPLLIAGHVITLIIQGLIILGAGVVIIGIPIVLYNEAHIVAQLAADHPGVDFTWPSGSILAIAVLALAALAMLFVFFQRLRQIIGTVGKGDPFVPENAERLSTMAWLMLSIHVISVPMGLLALHAYEQVENVANEDFTFDMGLDGGGILLIVVLFILARVFRKGTEMRDDLEGTV